MRRLALAIACGSCASASSGDLDYPAGPYGTQDGEVAPDLELRAASGTSVRLGDLRRDGVRAIVVYATGTWCFSCKDEVPWLNRRTDGPEVKAFAVLVESERFQRATPSDAEEFKAALGARFPVILDPEGRLDGFRAGGVIPVNLVIEPSTMRIVHREDTFNPTTMDHAVDGLLRR